MAMQLGGLNIPPLQKGEHIEDWEKLFRAGVAPLLAQEGGELLAISYQHTFVEELQKGKLYER